MKTIVKKEFIILAILFLINATFNSCREDKEIVVSEEYQYGTLSGEWQFDLMPDSSYQDTTIVEGIRISDFEEKGASYDEILLYENNQGNIYGEMLGYKISGTRKVNDIELIFYAYPEGPLNTNTPLKEMTAFSKMQLQINEFGIINGTGSYYDDPKHIWTQHDAFVVYARKIKDITNAHLRQNSITNDLCNIAAIFESFAISMLTDGVFRPISSCYGEKVGGGYYVFGHEGPGSIFPVLTSTIYVAWEKSWCKARKYSFEVQLHNASIGYEALKAIMQQLEFEYNLIVKKLDFPTYDEFGAMMDEFYQTYGGFAFSVGYNTYTHNMTLYVNIEKGEPAQAAQHPMVLVMADGLNDLCNTITVKAGLNIQDDFLMKRSDLGACNSMIIFYYLFGTNNVIYN